jgi:hypothetical protein
MRLLILLLLVVVNVTAQLNPIHRKYTTDDGLGSNTIYSFFQMKNGRMVVGHDLGISFFDGVQFTNPEYNVSPRSIYLSVTINNDELLCINFQGKSFRIIEDTLYPFDTSIMVKKLFTEGNDSYLITLKEVYLLEDNLHSKMIFNFKDLLDVFFSGTVYDDKLFLAGLKDSLYYLAEISLDDFQLSSYNQINFAPDFFQVNGELLMHDHQTNSLYPSQFLKFDKIKQWPHKFKINFLYSLKNGTILVGSQDGMMVYDAFWNLKHHFFKGIPISKAFQDVEENIWLGTLNEGLFIIDNIDFLEFLVVENISKNTTISNTLQTSNNLIIGTYNGQIIALNEACEMVWKTDLNKDAEIQGLYFNAEKNTILAYCQKLYEINLSNGNVLEENIVTSTKSIDVKNGSIVCGTSMGLALSTIDFNCIHKELWIRNLYFLNENEIILETQLGIKFWSNEKGLFKELKHPKNLEPENLTFWKDKYLVKYGDSLYEIDNYKIKPFEWQPKSIFKLGATQEYLYASHFEGGFSFFDGESSENYHSQSGLHNFKINKIHFWNKKWFLMSDKSFRVIPFQKNQKNIHPNLVISKIEGSFVLQNNIWKSEYENNIFKVICQLYPNVSDFGEGKVFYRIKGVRDEWVLLNKSSEGFKLVLERLPFGNYQLEIKGVNISGNSSDIVTYELIIAKPFYLSWWFLSMVALCLVIIIYIIIKWREQIIQKKNLEKLKKERLQIQALKSELAAIRSQMNPHLIFNSLSSIQTKILSNQSKEAYEHLVIFTKLLRQALEFSQREYISLKEELTFLTNYINLEFLRKDDSFSWKLEQDESVNLDSVYIPSLLLQPFVENAIIHGLMHSTSDKHLLIHVIQGQNNGFIVVIEDNGIGREASAKINQNRVREHASFALKATNDRIAMINKSGKLQIRIEIVDLNPGTRVEVYVNSKTNTNESTFSG